MPGFIDSHIHLNDIDNLKKASKWGVTTMLDMMCVHTELVDSLRNQKGLTDIQSCYEPVLSEPMEMFTNAVGGVSDFAQTKEDVKRIIDNQIKKGAQYIKIILENPPMAKEMLSEELINETVKYSHEKGKLTFAHTTSVEAYRRAANCGVDVLNHIPKDEIIPEHIIDMIKEKDLTVIPTLIMQQGLINAIKKIMPDKKNDYSIVEKSVQLMHKKGVRIIAGTDANMTNKLNYIEHGTSIHKEFELMAQAGFSNKEILNSATALPSKMFNLKNRGEIKVGYRADLILVKGNPLENIADTKNIVKVWIEGIEI